MMNFLGGLIAALVLVSGSRYVFAQAETISLTIEGTVSDSLPAEMAEVAYTLDVPASEFFTVNFKSEAEEGTISGLASFTVRDANGADIAPIPPSMDVYWAGEALPYTLSVTGYNYAYTIELQAGDTHRQDRGTLTPGSTLNGQLEAGDYEVYTLEAEEGDRITLRYIFNNFFARVYPQQSANSEALADWQSLPPNLSLTVRQDTDPFSVTITDVYRFAEVGTYNLIVDSASGGSYEILVDEGDTLERQEIGTLAPHERIETVMPSEDGIQYTIRLNVEYGEVYTMQQWSDTRSPFVIVDANLVPIAVSDRYVTTNEAIQFTLDDHFVLPIDLMIETLGYEAGKPLIYTFGWDEAVTLEEADPAGAGPVSRETSEAPENPTAPTDCTVSSSENINQRSGPGTNFDRVGTLSNGATAVVDGQATGADGFVWWRLEGVWVRSDVVVESGNCENVPVVTP